MINRIAFVRCDKFNVALQVVVMLTSTRSFRGRNLLATAVESGNADIIRTLVGIVDGHKLGTKQVRSQTPALLEESSTRNRSVA